MEDNPDPNLEQLIHRELRGLPEHQAPPTLIPRVLAAIEECARQWWRRPWLTWPRSAQLVSGAVLLVIVTGAVYLSFAAENGDATSSASETILQQFPLLEALWTFCAALLSGLLALLRAGESWLIYAMGLVFLMYLACVGIGTVCFRMAFNQRSEP